MTDPRDRPTPPAPDDARVHDDEGLYPSGEGVSETPIHATYESIALRNELARQLENVVAAGRAWARAEDTTEALAIADALAEIYDRVGMPSEESESDGM
ncbi:MAG: hypothetical protein R6T93_08075 [Trueperaceae bacterium]